LNRSGNGGACIDTKTGAYNNGSNGIFNPSFPGSCPYITSVGATEILNGSSVRTPESACETVIFSGGGFSNVFAMPSYQSTAMKTYYADHAPAFGADRFNNSQKVRGFPDVSANGANYVTAVDGKFSLSFGTSASAPTFGAIVNLINEQRIAANKSPVGFINPALYANPQVLNDVTNGNNPGCGTEGFKAVQGWDPLTGLG
jgi:tripeptidyl-peptidase-1